MTVAGNGTGAFNGDSIQATVAELWNPYGVALDDSANIYITDVSNHRIRKVDVKTGIIYTIAGTGVGGYNGDGIPATDAELNAPFDLAMDSIGNIYIADESNNRIRKIDAKTGIITTVAGNGTAGFSGDGGAATASKLYFPGGITIDKSMNLYIADASNSRIRKVNSLGIITTIAGDSVAGYSGDGGQATKAELYYPYGVCVDHKGDVYITDGGNSRI